MELVSVKWQNRWQNVIGMTKGGQANAGQSILSRQGEGEGSAFVQPMKNAMQSHSPNKNRPRITTHVALALLLLNSTTLPELWQLGSLS